MTYQEACKKAEERSIEHACAFHVYAILSQNNELSEPRILGYGITDWTSDAVVATFSNGKRIV
jgi:hypothetical protein